MPDLAITAAARSSAPRAGAWADLRSESATRRSRRCLRAFVCDRRAGYSSGQRLLLEGGLFNSAF
jgi:hypothetical protein